MEGLTGEKVDVKGKSIHVLRSGHGQQAVLLLPGALGSAATDWMQQLRLLDPAKFSLVGMTVAGFGDSTPPARDFTNFYQQDAEDGVELMKILGFSKFAVMGWSDGGIVALLAAIHHPQVVTKVVAAAANFTIRPEDADEFLALSDPSALPDFLREAWEGLYEPDLLKQLLKGWVAAMVEYSKREGGLYNNRLGEIGCPTLILHCSEDDLVPEENADQLHKAISGSSKMVFPKGRHDMQKCTEENASQFNSVVSEFLLKSTISL